MLNPLIYILRNREIKEVLRHLILRMSPSLWWGNIYGLWFVA
jgi:hypothetical protein